MREDSYAQSIKYVMVKLCNAPAQARDGCARGGQDHVDRTGPDDELSKVSMDLTVVHCPLCLRPLTHQVYEVRIHLVRSAD